MATVVKDQCEVNTSNTIPPNDTLSFPETALAQQAACSLATATPEESMLTDELCNVNQYIVYHGDATLPDNWNWTSLAGKPYCVSMAERNGKIVANKGFLVIGDTVQYHIRGKRIAPEELACNFSTLQELNDIISNFCKDRVNSPLWQRVVPEPSHGRAPATSKQAAHL